MYNISIYKLNFMYKKPIKNVVEQIVKCNPVNSEPTQNYRNHVFISRYLN